MLNPAGRNLASFIENGVPLYVERGERFAFRAGQDRLVDQASLDRRPDRQHKKGREERPQEGMYAMVSGKAVEPSLPTQVARPADGEPPGRRGNETDRDERNEERHAPVAPAYFRVAGSSGFI